MGEVYRVRDPRLAREVAVKLIVERYAADPDRVQRFAQEARAAGQLNHPNLVVVHDIGFHHGAPYIVTELLDGESLRALLKRGPLTARRAVDYARQMAEGLSAAHAKGIVHRDLKPENVFVGPDDRIKILDFGLAKLTQASGEVRPPDQETEIGALLGTITYMSPEQVRGEVLDIRSDLFGLGVVLLEMLTGRPPFARATRADSIAAILNDDPTSSLPSEIAPALARTVVRCLEKTRESRFQSARDLAFSLDVLSRSESAPVRASHRSWRRSSVMSWAIAASLAAVLAATVGWFSPGRTAPPPPMRLSVDLGADAAIAPLAAQFGNAFAISADGSTLAFVGQRNRESPTQLYVRRLGESRAEALPGTDGANAPFFSPDGAWIGFDTGLELKKVAVTGGAPVVLTPIASFRGASWTTDGTIVFSPGNRNGVRLMRIPATGGTPVAVTTLGEHEALHIWPQVLPGGSGVLYTSSRVTGAFNDANLVVQPLPDGAPRIIQRGGYHGTFVASGHILFVHDGALHALPFDANRLEPTGPPIRVIDGLASNRLTGGAQFSVTDTGTLVYLAGPSIGAGAGLTLIDRTGQATPYRTSLANWLMPSFAPDGRRLALALREGPLQTGDIWLHQTGIEPLVRVTADTAVDEAPVWTSDGRRITFASDREHASTQNLYWQNADGPANLQRLTISSNEQQPGSWHPSGRFLAFDELTHETMRDVMILPMEGDDRSGWKPGTPTVFVNGPRMDWDPHFSPDGRWLAYSSMESERWEVYVRPFPGPGAAVQISTVGGEMPTWSRTRREVLYGVDGQVMVVPYMIDGTRFVAGTPHPWAEARYQARGRIRMFDLHPDGNHIVLADTMPNRGEPRRSVEFVFNFFDELRRLAPQTP
jgi:serine/threonine-protein kinase